MTDEQIRHNADLDRRIREADEEYAVHVADMDNKRQKWIQAHPDDPTGHLMFLVLISKCAIHGIRYID
jgi:hypothetical protein